MTRIKTKAFTLIELLVVISVIGLLSSIVLVNTRGSRAKAKIAKGLEFSQTIHNSLGSEAVGVWDFDNCTAQDASGYGNNGTISGAICSSDTPYSVLGQGSGKNSLSFDGVDDYVNVGNRASIQIFGTNKWTITWWANIIGTGDNPQDLFNGVWHKPRIYSAISSRNIGLAGFVGGVYTSLIVSDANIYSFNAWTHFIIEADTTLYRLFVNGVQVKTASYVQMDSSFSSLRIGMSGGIGNSFKGLIDDVRIYSQALSQSQIQQHYAEGLEAHNNLVLLDK